MNKQGKVEKKRVSYRLKILKRSASAVAGLIIVILVTACAIFSPWISPYGPNDTDLYAALKPPDGKHLLGTDKLGRDVMSRIIWGARVSLEVGIIAVGIGMIAGVFFGLVGGYYGGMLDMAIFSIMDLLLSFPSILLAIAIVATLGPGIVQVMVAVGISMIPRFARVARGSVLSLREQYFIIAEKGVGASNAYILIRHILPNVLTPIIVLATLNCAFAITMEAGLSFLGIGIQPPDPTWGTILSDGRESIRTGYWISTFSGLAITLTVLGFNLFGDGLRDMLDPKTRSMIQSK